MKAGAKLNFGKAEVYWPQDDTASDKYQTLLGVKSDPSAQSKDLISPTFDAKVKIDAAIDILVTPEVSLSSWSQQALLDDRLLEHHRQESNWTNANITVLRQILD